MWMVVHTGRVCVAGRRARIEGGLACVEGGCAYIEGKCAYVEGGHACGWVGCMQISEWVSGRVDLCVEGGHACRWVGCTRIGGLHADKVSE